MKIFRKISVFAIAALAVTTALTSCSDDDLSTNQYGKSGVNILGFGPMPITRGETMRVTGTQLNNVESVIFPEGNQKVKPADSYIKADFVLKNSQEMTVTIPDQTVPGKLRLVTKSNDTIVSASNISFVEDIKVTSWEPKTAHPGDIITIKGEFVWNIGEVVFYDHVVVPAENFLLNTRNEIQVEVPAECKTGELAYNNGAANAENVVLGNLSVDYPQISGISNPNPEFGETVTVTGENLDLVTKVELPVVGEVSFNVANDGKSIRLTIPENAVSGTITMTSAAGLTTSIDYTVPLASFESVTPNKDVKADMTITIKGQNLDRIKQLILPGVDSPLEKGQFTQSKTEITFVVPEDMTDGKVKMIQHENWSIETGGIMMYSEAAEIAIWVGEFVCSSWSGNQDLAWGGFDWTTVPAGSAVKFYYKKNTPGTWGCISLRHGTDWGALPAPIPGQYDLDADEGVLSVVFTKEVLDDIIANGGLVLTGDNYTLTKVTIPSPETVLWKGELGPTNWSGDKTIPLTDEMKALLKPGIKMGIDFKCDAGGGQVEICGSWWTGLEGPKLVYGTNAEGRAIMDFPADATNFEWTLVQQDIDILLQQGAILFVGNGGLTITRWYVK